MTTQITVTQEDITNGFPGSYTSCPVALALRRVFPEEGVDVDSDSLIIGDREVETSEAVGGFMEEFDEGSPVEPFTFTLELPEP